MGSLSILYHFRLFANMFLLWHHCKSDESNVMSHCHPGCLSSFWWFFFHLWWYICITFNGMLIILSVGLFVYSLVVFSDVLLYPFWWSVCLLFDDIFVSFLMVCCVLSDCVFHRWLRKVSLTVLLLGAAHAQTNTHTRQSSWHTGWE